MKVRVIFSSVSSVKGFGKFFSYVTEPGAIYKHLLFGVRGLNEVWQLVLPLLHHRRLLFA
jgi:hypothetical protein